MRARRHPLGIHCEKQGWDPVTDNIQELSSGNYKVVDYWELDGYQLF